MRELAFARLAYALSWKSFQRVGIAASPVTAMSLIPATPLARAAQGSCRETQRAAPPFVPRVKVLQVADTALTIEEGAARLAARHCGL